MDKLKEQAVRMIQNMTGEAADALLADAVTEQVTASVCARLHARTIPEGIRPAVVQTIAGRYLQTALRTGLLEVRDGGQRISAMSMGDTSVSYDNSMDMQTRMKAMADDYAAAVDPLIPYFRSMVIYDESV